MKYFCLILLIFCCSCASIKYSVKERKNDFSRVKIGEKYVVWANEDFKQQMTLTSLNNDSIRGTFEKENFVIAKNNVTKIRKNKTVETVLISSLGATVAFGFVVMALISWN